MLQSSSKQLVTNFSRLRRCSEQRHAFAQYPLSLNATKTSFRNFFNSCKRDDEAEGFRRRVRLREDSRDYIHIQTGSPLAKFNMQLQAYAADGRPIEALKVCERMRLEGVEPDLTTYNCVITSLASASLYQEAWGVYCDMLAMGILPDIDTLNQLLRAARNQPTRIIDKILRQFELYVESPDHRTYDHLIDINARGLNFETALKLYAAMESQDIARGVGAAQAVIEQAVFLGHYRLALDFAKKFESESVQILDSEIWTKILGCCAENLYAEGVVFCWEKVVNERAVTLDEGLCMQVLHTASRHGHPPLAAESLEQLELLGVRFGEQHLSSLLESFCAAGKLKEAFQVIGLFHSAALTPSLATVSPIVHLIQRDSDAIDHAWALLNENDEASEKRPDPLVVNCILQACVYQNDLQRAFGIYKSLPDLGLQPDALSFTLLLDGCIQAKHRDLGERLLKEMKEAGISMNAEIYERVILLHLTQSSYEDAFFFLEEMKGQNFKPTYHIYDMIVQKCISAGDPRYKLALEELQQTGYNVLPPLRNKLKDATANGPNIYKRIELSLRDHRDNMEASRMKADLDKAQKCHKDVVEKLEKLKSKYEASEQHVYDLKKVQLADQGELKSLRNKLRILELERTKFTNKQSEILELKKNVNATEKARKEETQLHEQRLAEMRRHADTSKVQSERQISGLQATVSNLRGELQSSQSEVSQLREAYERLELESTARDDERLQQLQQLNFNMNVVAQEYGRLVGNTIARSVFSQIKGENVSLQRDVWRLERKLANREDQIQDLIFLIRQYKEKNDILTAVSEDTFQYLQTLTEDDDTYCQEIYFYADCHALESHLQATSQMNYADQIHLQESVIDAFSSTCEVYELHSRGQLLQHYGTSTHLKRELQHVDALTLDLLEAQSAREKLDADSRALQSEKHSLLQQNLDLNSMVRSLNAKMETLEKGHAGYKAQSKAESARLHEQIKQERDANAKLTSALQRGKASEEAFRDEIQQLSTELSEAESWKDAYQELLQEAQNLLTKNVVAEEEANHLSKVNAEILGHRNPMQRIYYVDKIRRELADTKHKLLMRTRDQETTQDENEALKNELFLYKSTTVPPVGKPRTAVTRINRMPLTSRLSNENIPPTLSEEKLGPYSLQERPEDMTIEEII